MTDEVQGPPSITDLLPDVEVEYVDIDALMPAPYNPRKIKDADFKRLVGSIREFGFVEPVVVNRANDNSIVGGHQRVAAAKEAGYTQAPVIFVELSPEKERLLNLALNKISGEWDDEKLAEVFKELRVMGADLEQSGFTDEEADKVIAKVAAPDEFAAADVDIDTSYKCPSCGYEWSGQPKPGEDSDE